MAQKSSNLGYNHMETRTITLRIDRDLFDAIHKMSAEQDRSYTWIINKLIRLGLGRIDDINNDRVVTTVSIKEN